MVGRDAERGQLLHARRDGVAASFSLGLALALPKTPVWTLNADGSLCMNLGCLLTEAAQAPANLRHFVIDNGVYQTVGGLPMVNAKRTDYVGFARSAGIRSVFAVRTTAELERDLPGMLAAPGPAFMSIAVQAESGFLGTPPMTYEGPEMKYRFGRALERKLGIKVFGPQGY